MTEQSRRKIEAAERLCAEQPSCDTCRFLQGGRCVVLYAEDEMNEQTD